MDRTLILVKPDAFARGLTGEIIARFERKGLRLVALKHMTVDEDLAKRHYAEHDGKPFFGELVEFITSGPLVAMVLEGDEAVDGRAPGHRRDEPARGRARLDPRRLRDRGRPEHGPRLGLAGVRRARGGAVLPRAVPGVARLTGARSGSELVLACRSPQRRAILEQLGVAVRGRGRSTCEERRGRARRRRARERAAQGARPCEARPERGRARRRHVVASALEICGKPPDEEAARETLRRLAGRTHAVVSGVALVDEGGAVRADEATTEVDVPPARRRADRLVPRRAASGDGRAGGYAIQGRGGALVERIEGDYLNVVGLPVARHACSTSPPEPASAALER